MKIAYFVVMDANHKQKKRILKIKWLMFASIAIVSIFVMQWLQSQWRIQKGVLKDDLEHIINTCENEYKDSVIIATLNSLMSLDTSQLSSHARVNLNLKLDSARISAVDSNFITENNIKSANDTVFIHNLGNCDTIPEANPTTLAFQELIASLMSSMNNISGPEKLKDPDFISLKNAIYHRIVAKNKISNPSISLVDVLGDSTIKADFNILSFKHTELLFGVQNSDSYLFKKIVPQIIFSFFLLVVIILSFYWTLKTLRNQYLFNLHKTNFTNNISHELKTPIATTKIALEALEDYNLLDDKVNSKRYIQVARFEVERLNIMVNKFMDYINSDSSRIQIEPTNFAVSDIFLQIFESLDESLKSKQLDISELNLNLPMYGDKIQLFNVFFNLVDNAVKYGGEAIKITSDIDQNQLRIQIMDNGKGIIGSDKLKVFDPYYRVISEDNQHNVKGHGLGLSFAKMIIEAHNGSIQITQNTVHNCIFIVKLPLY